LNISDIIPQIIIKDLDYVYPNGTKALNQINLIINKGDFIAIMGQNGAGKTTLIRTLNGLLRPTKGHIYLDGKNISDKTIANLSKAVGIVFQNPAHQLFSNTIEEEIRFSLKNLDLSKEEIQNKTSFILDQFNLRNFKDRSPFNLSGGETKKLALASIICRDPRILIFDEPTIGQDAKEIKFIIDLIRSERKAGKTIIIVTHNIDFSLEYIPRTILMSNGYIIADGPSRQILNNKDLISKTSLILPQIFQFKKLLKDIGLKIPEDLFKQKEIISFLETCFKLQKLKVREVNT
jgi:energy-coupling factor transport system ATP-binding protein